jgi:hypothetical protein
MVGLSLGLSRKYLVYVNLVVLINELYPQQDWKFWSLRQPHQNIDTERELLALRFLESLKTSASLGKKVDSSYELAMYIVSLLYH